MGYCSSEDLLKAVSEASLIRYTDDAGAGEPDADVIAGAIVSASDLVDSFISGRYGAGLSPVPGVIKSLAVDITIYKLSGRRGDAPEEYRKKYEDALALLSKIQSGKADIPGVVIEEDTGTTSAAAAVVTRPQVFTADGLEGY